MEKKFEKFGWKALVINLFLLFWIVGMTAGMSAGGCRKKTEPSKKLGYCNVTIVSGAIVPGSAERRSILYFERGIALSQLDRMTEASRDFRRAILDSSSREFFQMTAHMGTVDDDEMREAWRAAFVSTRSK